MCLPLKAFLPFHSDYAHQEILLQLFRTFQSMIQLNTVWLLQFLYRVFDSANFTNKCIMLC